jgi:hypothetical protein
MINSMNHHMVDTILQDCGIDFFSEIQFLLRIVTALLCASEENYILDKLLFNLILLVQDNL